jgi:hypothetical protein
VLRNSPSISVAEISIRGGSTDKNVRVVSRCGREPQSEPSSPVRRSDATAAVAQRCLHRSGSRWTHRIHAANFLNRIDCVRRRWSQQLAFIPSNFGSPLIAACNISNRTSPLATGAAFLRGEIAAGTRMTLSRSSVSIASGQESDARDGPGRRCRHRSRSSSIPQRLDGQSSTFN